MRKRHWVVWPRAWHPFRFATWAEAKVVADAWRATGAKVKFFWDTGPGDGTFVTA